MWRDEAAATKLDELGLLHFFNQFLRLHLDIHLLGLIGNWLYFGFIPDLRVNLTFFSWLNGKRVTGLTTHLFASSVIQGINSAYFWLDLAW